MSAVLDTPLNGLGMIPLVSAVEGLKTSKSYRDALNTVVSACRGKSLSGMKFLPVNVVGSMMFSSHSAKPITACTITIIISPALSLSLYYYLYALYY